MNSEKQIENNNIMFQCKSDDNIVMVSPNDIVENFNDNNDTRLCQHCKRKFKRGEDFLRHVNENAGSYKPKI
jgi:hypothetical protein